jgi:hypothetical protein
MPLCCESKSGMVGTRKMCRHPMRQLALIVSHAGTGLEATGLELACDVAGWMLSLGTAAQATPTVSALRFGRCLYTTMQRGCS